MPGRKFRQVGKFPDPRKIRMHLSYTTAELAELLEVHEQTVRRWIKSGLPIVACGLPRLILGYEAKQWLKAQRTGRKQPLGLGEFYCFKCKSPRFPHDMEADLEKTSPQIINLVGLCSLCGSLMYRRINPRKFSLCTTNLTIRVPEALEQLIDREIPSLNDQLN